MGIGFDFQAQPLWINLAIFTIAAGVVWSAGTRVAEYADGISVKTNLGGAFIGFLLLAVATETPEIGTTVTAATEGNAALAVNNIFGGIAMQTAIIAVVDILVVRGALTGIVPDPVLLLEGVLLTGLLGLALAGIASRGQLPSIFGIGLWPPILFVVQLLVLYLAYRYRGRERWVPGPAQQESTRNAENPATCEMDAEAKEDAEGTDGGEEQKKSYEEQSLGRLFLFFSGGTLAILAAGMMLAQTADALAVQTGLGQSFVGATLLATSTSLPELSTAVSAARLGNYSMAISNIFGSNTLMVLLLFVADLFYRQGPILMAANAPVMFSAAMGVVLTSVYVVGLLEREDKTVLGMGVDSAVVLVLYLATLVVLYFLRGAPV